MTTDPVDLKMFDLLARAIEEAPKNALPHVQMAMEYSVALLHDRLAEYPPASEANRPGRVSLITKKAMGYYERGRGWWYPVKRRMTLGVSTGKRLGAVKAPKGVTGIAGYKLIRSSERLGSKWTRRVTVTDEQIQGEVGTTVSYANLVQGEKQTGMHQERGWVTAADALDEAMPEIIAAFNDAAVRIVDDLKKLI